MSKTSIKTAAMGAAVTATVAAAASADKVYYRKDGVRIQHDPYSRGMSNHYGEKGRTDPEGFDPYADTVGPGIYGGNVKMDKTGKVLLGRQYQNHNSQPGPIYDGSGYSPMSRALKLGTKAIQAVIDTMGPDAVNEISTGGATPLHMCGMSRQNQKATAFIIEKGGNIDALDTYGYTPLHRMASNNLAIGAKALLDAGANPSAKTFGGETPWQTAKSSEAWDVLKVFNDFKKREEVKREEKTDDEAPKAKRAVKLVISKAGLAAVNGNYWQCPPSDIPKSFAEVCQENGWPVAGTWKKLTDGKTPWFLAENGSYIYWNRGDRKWWLDEPSGLGAYTMHIPLSAFHSGDDHWPLPVSGQWVRLDKKYGSTPKLKLL